MKPEDLKNSMNSIKPDSYMETRLFAEVSSAEKPKKKNRKILKAGVCTALCCAVLVTGIGIGIPKNIISDSNKNAVETENNNNYFVMSVYAAENETATPIDEPTVIIPYYKATKDFQNGVAKEGFPNGGYVLEIYSENSLYVSGNDIKSVKFATETGILTINDYDSIDYLIKKGEYYDVIVPYSEDYEKSTNSYMSIFLNHFNNGDYDEYIDKKKMKSMDEYSNAEIICDENYNRTGVGLVTREQEEKYWKIIGKGDEYTFVNYFNKTEEIGEGALWIPDYDGFVEGKVYDKDMPLSEIPHDIITVEVAFNDGSVKTQKYDFSFNDDGLLVAKKIMNK